MRELRPYMWHGVDCAYDTLGLAVSNLGRVSIMGGGDRHSRTMDGASTADKIPSSELARLHR